MKRFCLAYTHDIEQAENIASYPLAVMSDDHREPYVELRNTVKQLNPDIKILGYVQVATETTNTVQDRGYGIPHMANLPWNTRLVVDNQLAMYPNNKRFLFDYREIEWQVAFQKCCDAVLNVFDGIFLDNCVSRWSIQGLDNHEGLTKSLQDQLLDLRRRYPDRIIVGNGRQNWQGLNGEMLESNDPNRYEELKPSPGQIQPNMNMLMNLDRSKDQETISAAEKYDCWLALQDNYQTIPRMDK